MLNVQHLIPRLSPRALAGMTSFWSRPVPGLWSFRHYLRIAAPEFALPAPPAAVPRAPRARRVALHCGIEGSGPGRRSVSDRAGRRTAFGCAQTKAHATLAAIRAALTAAVERTQARAPRAERPPAYEKRSTRNARPTRNHSNPLTWRPEPRS